MNARARERDILLLETRQQSDERTREKEKSERAREERERALRGKEGRSSIERSEAIALP